MLAVDDRQGLHWSARLLGAVVERDERRLARRQREPAGGEGLKQKAPFVIRCRRVRDDTVGDAGQRDARVPHRLRGHVSGRHTPGDFGGAGWLYDRPVANGLLHHRESTPGENDERLHRQRPTGLSPFGDRRSSFSPSRT